MSFRKPSKTIFSVEADTAPKEEDKRVQPKAIVSKREDNGLYTLKLTAGGELPALLKGYYTTGVRAEKAAEAYLLSKKDGTSNS